MSGRVGGAGSKSGVIGNSGVQVASLRQENSAGSNIAQNTTGSYLVLDLNTSYDPSNLILGISSQRFKISPGRYSISGYVEVIGAAGDAASALYDYTNSSYIVYGQVAYSSGSGTGGGYWSSHIPVIWSGNINVTTEIELRARFSEACYTAGGPNFGHVNVAHQINVIKF